MAKTSEEINQIALENQNLVYYVAKNFANYGIPMEDLFQAGFLGLMHAVEKYDASLGYTFSTYAIPWIEREIRLELKTDSAYIPYYIHSKKNVIRAVINQLTENGLPVTPEAIAEKVDLPVERIKDVLPHLQGTKSLDATIGEDDTTVGDFVADDSVDFEGDYVHLETMKAVHLAVNRIPKVTPKIRKDRSCLESRIASAYAKLPPMNSKDFAEAVAEYSKLWNAWIKEQPVDAKMRDILSAYYFGDASLEEICEDQMVSKQCIHQKRNKALERLKMDPLVMLAQMET